MTRALFLSTPSARRATFHAKEDKQMANISIHALREEGDRGWSAATCSPSYFYPRPPRGGRRRTLPAVFSVVNFYPRPPRGGRRGNDAGTAGGEVFLSTPSARRATCCKVLSPHSSLISIHALREEGDDRTIPLQGIRLSFLSTPSARRATRPPAGGGGKAGISIHALREEGDLGALVFGSSDN